jgi:hypothetical protein
VAKPLQVFEDDDDRSLIEHGCIKACQQPWELSHPPQKTARAVQMPVVFTLLMCARATAYRWMMRRGKRFAPLNKVAFCQLCRHSPRQDTLYSGGE